MADAAQYNIGAAARLSGVSREKIRMWERRYGAVVPGRDAGNHRLYSHEDVERLSRIRALVSRGHAVSKVANLALAQLDDLLASASQATTRVAAPGRALLISDAGEDLADLLSAAGIADVGRADDITAAERWLAGQETDVIVVEVPTLHAGDLPALTRLRRRAPEAQTLVVFRFAPQPVLEEVRSLGMQTVKAPLERHDLQLPPPGLEATPLPNVRARRFTAAELREAAALGEHLLCECPRHLADLITELNAFEDYSLECQVDSVQDAAIHREIYDTVARARALVEDALTIVTDEHREA